MAGNPLQQDDDALFDLQQVVARLLVEEGLASPAARIVACRISREMRSHWGGQQIYIKKTDGEQLSLRDLEIFAEFNGHNHEQLARKHGLTVPYIYRIVKLVGQAEREKRQHGLFREEGEDES